MTVKCDNSILVFDVSNYKSKNVLTHLLCTSARRIALCAGPQIPPRFHSAGRARRASLGQGPGEPALGQVECRTTRQLAVIAGAGVNLSVQFRCSSAAARPNRFAVMPLSVSDSSQESTTSSSRTRLTWQYSTETFVIAATDSRAGTVMPDTLMPVLEGRLYFMSSDRKLHTSGSSTMHFFTMDQEMRYNPFCNDHG